MAVVTEIFNDITTVATNLCVIYCTNHTLLYFSKIFLHFFGYNSLGFRKNITDLFQKLLILRKYLLLPSFLGFAKIVKALFLSSFKPKLRYFLYIL
jgi:hypothetical protein